MALFSNKHQSLDALPQDAEIAIPNDTVNEARALLLLQANGLVSFTSETSSPSVDDIDTATSKVKVTPVDATQTVLSLESVDGSVINNDFLKDAGLNPKDALAQDDPANESARPYVNLFVAQAKDADNETYKRIVELFHTSDVQAVVQEETQGTAVEVMANRPVNFVLNFLVNVVRPIPFIILLAALGPLTQQVVGTRLGTNAAIFAMVCGATFAVARIVEQNMVSIDPGVIEAARAMGASKPRILFTVMIPEALGPLILGYTFLVIGVVDMSAMAGYIGGGGLGRLALVDGYQRFNETITWSVVAVIIVLVQLIQLAGSSLARRIMRR